MNNFNLIFLQATDAGNLDVEYVLAPEFQTYFIILAFPIIAAIAGAILLRKSRAKAFVLSLVIGYLFLYLIAAWMYGWDLKVAVEPSPQDIPVFMQEDSTGIQLVE